MTGKKDAPVQGHKCRGVRLYVSVSCECGWHSDQMAGEGARASAYGQWRRHAESCKNFQDVTGRNVAGGAGLSTKP